MNLQIGKWYFSESMCYDVKVLELIDNENIKVIEKRYGTEFIELTCNLKEITPYTLEDVVQFDPSLVYGRTGNGFIIREDGSILRLKRPQTHGVVMALLYPELAESQDYPLPHGRNSKLFQQFEIVNQNSFPEIRIAFGFLFPCYISYGDIKPTKAQIESLRKCVLLSEKLYSKVQTNEGEIVFSKLLKELTDALGS